MGRKRSILSRPCWARFSSQGLPFSGFRKIFPFERPLVKRNFGRKPSGVAYTAISIPPKSVVLIKADDTRRSPESLERCTTARACDQWWRSCCVSSSDFQCPADFFPFDWPYEWAYDSHPISVVKAQPQW